MLDCREAPAVVYRQGNVYIMGGKFVFRLCERYSLERDTWKNFASLIEGRHNATATLMHGDDYIYCIGGFPEWDVGQSFERFSFETETWEKIHFKFPVKMINPGIFPLDDTRIGLLAGRYTSSVYILEVTEYNDSEVYKLTEIEGFPHMIECIYPMIYIKSKRICYMIIGRSGQDDPAVVTWPIRNFDRTPILPPKEYERSLAIKEGEISKSSSRVLPTIFQP